MAKKQETKEKETKKTVSAKKKTNETKRVGATSDTKPLNKKQSVNNDAAPAKKEKEVATITISTSLVKKIVGSLVAVLLVGLFIYSVVETNGRLEYFKTISFDEVADLMNDDETNIIYWAQTGCGACMQFTPIVEKVTKREKVTFNHLNASNLTMEQYSAINEHFAKFDESYATQGVGTPAIILVKDGAITDIKVGAIGEDGLMSYLKSKGFVK